MNDEITNNAGNPTDFTEGSSDNNQNIQDNTFAENQQDTTVEDQQVNDVETAEGSEPQEGNVEDESPYENDPKYWKQRYAESTKEGQRLAQAYKEAESYAQIGKSLAYRYNNEPEFKAKFDELTPKQKADAIAQDQVTGQQQQVVQPDLSTHPDIAWARKQREAETMKQGEFFAKLETKEDGQVLDKFNQVAVDSNGMPILDSYGRQMVQNPQRMFIGQTTLSLQKQLNIPFEEAAKRAYNMWKVGMNPNATVDAENAGTQGLIDGLQSNAVSTYGSSKGPGKRAKKIDFDEAQQKIITSLGLDPNDPTFLGLAEQNGL